MSETVACHRVAAVADHSYGPLLELQLAQDLEKDPPGHRVAAPGAEMMFLAKEQRRFAGDLRAGHVGGTVGRNGCHVSSPP